MLLVLLWLSFMYGMYNGAMVVALTEVMPVEVRVAGFSLAYSLATAVFGGFTPVDLDRADPMHRRQGRARLLGCSFAAVCGLGATLALYRRGATTLIPAHCIRFRAPHPDTPTFRQPFDHEILILKTVHGRPGRQLGRRGERAGRRTARDEFGRLYRGVQSCSARNSRDRPEYARYRARPVDGQVAGSHSQPA